MNWTDIQAKWTAMTRRVRSDHLQNHDEMVVTSAPDKPPLLRDEVTELRAPAQFDRPAT